MMNKQQQHHQQQQQQRQPIATLCGCDTFVALPPVAPPGTCIFGKNSDRPCGEPQSVRRYPAADYDFSTTKDGNVVMLECTYLSIPQASHTYAVLLSQIDWMWGAEMGANECGVVIGNEAVWTVEPDDDVETPALLGMDLVRLGLERGNSAQHALEVITELLETHGQGGACAENDPSFTYHNSFLIADAKEAYVLETAGKQWVAEHVRSGTRNISNGLTIRTKFDLHSANLHEYAKKHGYWNGGGKKEGKEALLDWAATFTEGGAAGLSDGDSPYSRQGRGCALLGQQAANGSFSAEAMMEILRDHKGGLCMHGPGFETTASMVSTLTAGDPALCRHWMTGRPLPCQSTFVEESVWAPVTKGSK